MLRLIATFRRLVALLRRSGLEHDLDDELAFHMAMRETENVKQGVEPTEAKMAARRQFGNVLLLKDQTRDVWTLVWVESVLQDLRFAIRSLRRSPGFAAVATLTLAAGIGATTAIYGIVDTVLLQPLPFRNSDRLVRIVENFTADISGRVFQRGVTYTEFVEWKSQAKTLSDAAAVLQLGQRLVKTNNGMSGLWGASVSGNTFELLGRDAVLGRTLNPADDGNVEVVVLSFDTWRTHFNADAGILNRGIEMRVPQAPSRLLTVVGVMPRDFQLPMGQVDFYVPMAISRGAPRVTMLAALTSNASLTAARDEANLLGQVIVAPRPATARPLPGARFEVLQMKEELVGKLRPALRVLLGAAGALLLIVCANVANLFLARGTARQREIAVRLAIGASRGRIVRQILTESSVVAFVGGSLGAALGAVGVFLVRELGTIDVPGIFRLSFGSTVLPRAEEITVDLRVLAVALGLAAIACLIFGLLSAWHLSRTDRVHPLGAGSAGSRPEQGRMRAALVLGQLVIATVLLIGAGLLLHSFIRLSTVDKGYDATGVLALQPLFPDQYTLTRKVEVIEQILARLRAMPIVTAAGFSRAGVLIGEEIRVGTFVPPGHTLEEIRNDPGRPRLRPVSAGFVTAMGIPVLAGREFSLSEDGPIPLPIVISDSVARQYFGNSNPLGQSMNWHVGDAAAATTVIGVVEDLRNESLEHEIYPEIFVEYRQLMFLQEKWGQSIAQRTETAIGRLSLAIRTTAEPASVIPTVRQIVIAVDPNIGIDALVPLNHLVASSLTRQRFYAVIVAIFAGVAAFLAAIGIYGVLAYAVVQRTQEIGVRMALGAQPSQVIGLMLRSGLKLAAIGIVLGLVSAAGTTRLLRGMLFGITPLDPKTFVVVPLVFAAVAAVACYIPARRAVKVDPVIALRFE